MVNNDKPVRVVVVGCGGMARKWIDVTIHAPHLELVGLVDMQREAAEQKARDFKLPDSVVYDTLAEAVKATDAEAVFDVTIPAAHHAVTLEALKLGCHVLGEKPMSDSLDHARQMVAAAKQAGRHYAVTQTRRPLSRVLSVCELLRSGAIGTVEELHSDFYLGPHFGGFRDAMDDVLLVDMAIHTFDNARQIGAADPVSVYCHAFNPPHSWYQGDASAIAIFEMRGPAGEPIVYNYRGSWCAEGLPTSWEGAWRVIASQGTLCWDGGDNIRAQAVKPDGDHGFFREMANVDVPHLTLEREGHDHLIHEFGHCVRNGQSPMCPAEDNIKSLAMVLAAVKSTRSGQREKVEW
ncbi:MAG: Gfo/Idh/MocA family oxidoreductase [Phycisphaeraceae bacterium]